MNFLFVSSWKKNIKKKMELEKMEYHVTNVKILRYVKAICFRICDRHPSHVRSSLTN